jgi:hypothetical protein
VGGLAIYLEEEGLATTGISLIRLHTEKTNPPRALWVPFELGRPFGVPNDPAFQRRVVLAALALLDAGSGPLIVDYPEEVPPEAISEDDITGLSCPIELPVLPDPDAPTDALGLALMDEIASLAPWYDLAARSRGRTTVGLSGLPVEAAAHHLLKFVEDPTTPSYRDDTHPGHALKLAFEDLKSFYGEAIVAQPGYQTSRAVEDWLFGETVLGKTLWRLRDICRASDDPWYREYLGRNSIVPDRQINPP